MEKFWEQSIPRTDEKDCDYSDGRDDIPDFDDFGVISTSPAQDVKSAQPARLPTGKGEKRLVKDQFRRIHDTTRRIKEIIFNLQTALWMTSDEDQFVSDWRKKKIFFTLLKPN